MFSALSSLCSGIVQPVVSVEVCSFGGFLCFSPGLFCRFLRLNQHQVGNFLWMVI